MTPSRASELVPILEQEIVTGTLQPGTRLDETILAERFGVSRTPIRETLTRLAAAGLVVIRPRRGAVVATITIKDLMDMFEVMAELEGMCARLAARRITPDEKSALQQAQIACSSIVGSDNHDEYYQFNMTLHELMYKASHNDFLIKQTMELRTRLSPHRRLQVRIPGRMATSSDEHENLINAILQGKAEEAEQLTRKHVTIQGERFTDFLSTLPPHYLQATA